MSTKAQKTPMFDTETKHFVTTGHAPKFLGAGVKLTISRQKNGDEVLGASGETAAFNIGNGGAVFLTPEQVAVA